ncbi:MAG: ABC transporter permease [Chloroflexota bacterium]|nr:ABC transporter permease [Chloroflexota bacterium]
MSADRSPNLLAHPSERAAETGAGAQPEHTTLARAHSRRRGVARRIVGPAIPLVLYVIIAVVGPLLIPYDPITVRIGQRLKPPGSVLQDGTHAWLGTDQVGRDVLAQVVRGARVSLVISLATVIVAGLAGSALGMIAGYFGGSVDTVIMRLADIQLAFPSILLAILIAAVLGPSIANVIITLALTRWVTFARVARATTLTTREREFVTAAHASGANAPRILGRHIAPSVVAPFLVIATVEMGLVVIAEASLSFLGLGVSGAQPSWGFVIANGRDYLSNAWWISTMPGLALCFVVLSVGVFGDRVRDALDPRTAR